MRSLLVLLTLALVRPAFAAPKTVESLCGAMLLAGQNPAPRALVTRLIDQLQDEGAVGAEDGHQILLDLFDRDVVTVANFVKGDAPIAAYLGEFTDALHEFDHLGQGAYQNQRPSKAEYLTMVARGAGAQVAGLTAALHATPAIGWTLGGVGALYLIKQLAQAGHGLITYHSPLANHANKRVHTEAALDEFTRELARDRGATISYALELSVDDEYLRALLRAKDLSELPVEALGTALVRRRANDPAKNGHVRIDQIFFQDIEDGRNVMLTIVRIRHPRHHTPPSTELTTGNSVRGLTPMVAQ